MAGLTDNRERIGRASGQGECAGSPIGGYSSAKPAATTRERMKNQSKNSGVLYVEDDENDVFFLKIAFGKLGLGALFHAVRNGQEAVDYLAGLGHHGDRRLHPLPALLLLDLKLPILSGYEVLEWVRKQPAFYRLPVVIFSSSLRPDEKLKAFNLGANEYLEKPNSPLKFINLVERLGENWPELLVIERSVPPVPLLRLDPAYQNAGTPTIRWSPRPPP